MNRKLRVFGPLILWATLAGAAWAELAPDETLTAEELLAFQRQHADFVLFDARGKMEYEAAHIPGAVLPLSEDYYERRQLFMNHLIPIAPDREVALADTTKQYSKDHPIVTYCNRNCTASAALLGELKKLGFTNVRSMEEGLQSWQEKGFPVKIGAPPLTSKE